MSKIFHPLLAMIASSTDNYLANEYTEYYNTKKSHMERDWMPPLREREEPEKVATPTMDQIEVKTYVGGLVTSFERKAA